MDSVTHDAWRHRIEGAASIETLEEIRRELKRLPPSVQVTELGHSIIRRRIELDDGRAAQARQ